MKDHGGHESGKTIGRRSDFSKFQDGRRKEGMEGRRRREGRRQIERKGAIDRRLIGRSEEF